MPWESPRVSKVVQFKSCRLNANLGLDIGEIATGFTSFHYVKPSQWRRGANSHHQSSIFDVIPRYSGEGKALEGMPWESPRIGEVGQFTPGRNSNLRAFSRGDCHASIRYARNERLGRSLFFINIFRPKAPFVDLMPRTCS